MIRVLWFTDIRSSNSPLAFHFHDHVMQLMWGHRISRAHGFSDQRGTAVYPDQRLTHRGGSDHPEPQQPCLHISHCRVRKLNAPRTISISVRRARRNFATGFQELPFGLLWHFIPMGLGFFAGAESDIAQLEASPALDPNLSVPADLGYSRNSRVIPLTPEDCSGYCSCDSSRMHRMSGSECQCVPVRFCRHAFHRMFGRKFSGFASYQFNELSFDQLVLSGAARCNRICTGK